MNDPRQMPGLKPINRRQLLLAAVAATAGGVTRDGMAAAGGTHEYQVAAAVILKFSRYVSRWPAGREPGENPTLCVVTLHRATYDLFAGILQGKVEGRQTWSVVHARTLAEARGHPFVYIDAERPDPDDAFYAGAVRDGVLTVGEKDGAKARGCVIDLEIRRGEIRFDLNLKLARKAGIAIESSLAARARHVIRQ